MQKSFQLLSPVHSPLGHKDFTLTSTMPSTLGPTVEGSVNQVFLASPELQLQSSKAVPDSFQFCWIQNSPQEESGLVDQTWASDSVDKYSSSQHTPSATEEFYSCYSGGSTEKILSPQSDRSIGSWPRNQLEQLMQEIDASYQLMLKEDVGRYKFVCIPHGLFITLKLPIGPSQFPILLIKW